MASNAEKEPLVGGGEKPKDTKAKSAFDVSLVICLLAWFYGNYEYNLVNKASLKLAGGKTGIPLTLACIQLLVGVVYALFLWVAPDARPAPKTTWTDLYNMLPLCFCFAGAHLATVFSLCAGAVSFAQIVKAAEPAFAAFLGVTFYKTKVSTAKWICLIPVIGGVAVASMGELGSVAFSELLPPLLAGCLANLFAALRSNENKKVMTTAGLKDRLGSVGNQFAVTMVISAIMCVPVVLALEWNPLERFFGTWDGTFVTEDDPDLTPATSSSKFRWNLIAAGLLFYLYNEVSTIVIAKTNAVTQSVANTAKRVVVIIGCAIVLGENLDNLKLWGSAICVTGVFLYSVIDDLVAKYSCSVPPTVQPEGKEP